MIARPVRGAHICLSCRQSLARRSLLSRPQSASFASRHTLTTPRIPNPKKSQPPQPEANDDFEGEDGENTTAADFRRIRETPIVRPLVSKPHNKMYGHRGMKYQEDLEKLQDAVTLGDPAKVIVLRASKIKSYNVKLKIEPKKPKHIDIAAQVSEERGLVGAAEVAENINGFKPKHYEVIQNWDDMNALVEKLQNSFTTSQLKAYIDADREARAKRQREPLPKYPGTSITAVTRWRPGISADQSSFLDSPLRGYTLDSHTPKQRVAIQLIRECWALVLPEIRDGIGQFEISLSSKDELKLLQLDGLGFPSVLDTIKEKYLGERDETLDVIEYRGAIRFTTKQITKEMIAQDIEAALRRIQRERMDLSYLVPKQNKGIHFENMAGLHFSDATLEEAARLSNTLITKGTHHMIMASWLDEPNQETSKVEILRRILISSRCHVNNAHNRLEHQLVSTAASNVGSFIQFPPVQELPWNYRTRSWWRWAAPVSKVKGIGYSADLGFGQQEAASKKEILDKEGKKVALGLGPLSTAKVKGDGKESLPIWSPEYRTRTSSIMGNILHSPRNSRGGIGATVVGRKDLYHVFSSRIPNISQVISKMKDDNKSTRDVIVLRFEPNPFAKTRSPDNIKSGHAGDEAKKNRRVGYLASRAFPTIEMRLRMNQLSEKTDIMSIGAYVQDLQSDVMLPDSQVDVRFQQRIYSGLHSSFFSQFQSQFNIGPIDMNKSHFNIPSSVTFPLSRHLCLEHGWSTLAGSKPHKLFGPEWESVVDVEYLFTSMEIHRTLAYDFNGWRLSFDAIEGGKIGGRRGELSLRPFKYGKMMSEEEFVEKSYHLASMLDTGVLQGISKLSLTGYGNPTALKELDVNFSGRVLVTPLQHLFKYWMVAKASRLIAGPAKEEMMKVLEEQAKEKGGWEGMEVLEEDGEEKVAENEGFDVDENLVVGEGEIQAEARDGESATEPDVPKTNHEDDTISEGAENYAAANIDDAYDGFGSKDS